jgi:hypothetical protein
MGMRVDLRLCLGCAASRSSCVVPMLPGDIVCELGIASTVACCAVTPCRYVGVPGKAFYNCSLLSALCFAALSSAHILSAPPQKWRLCVSLVVVAVPLRAGTAFAVGTAGGNGGHNMPVPLPLSPERLQGHNGAVHLEPDSHCCCAVTQLAAVVGLCVCVTGVCPQGTVFAGGLLVEVGHGVPTRWTLKHACMCRKAPTCKCKD